MHYVIRHCLNLYYVHKPRLVLFTHSSIQGWLNSYWLLSALSCLFIYASIQSDEGSGNGTFGFSPSWEFFCDYLVVCIVLVTFAYMFMCSMDLLVCICMVCIVHTFPLVALSLSISFTLTFFVSVSFVWFLCETILGRFHLCNTILRLQYYSQ